MEKLKIWALVGTAFVIACGDDDRPGLDGGADPSDAEVMSDAAMPTDGMVSVDASPMDAEVADGGGEELDAGEADAGVDSGPPPDSCFDGMRNGDETDVDCGGPTCAARCEDRQRCSLRGDCQSDVCIGGTCIAPSCTDGIRNGDETGRDCGGPTCNGCPLGQACLVEDDCREGTCNGGFCVADHCFNGVRDVNETDVDCGGADCAPCLPGARCRTDRDCDMAMCLDSFCLTPECSNGILDVGEVDVDCGGECPGCPDGTACTLGADCLSDRCEGGVCTSCSDGVQNGAETAVDCGGGVCRGCPGGEACVDDDDCASRVCTDGVCEGAATYYRETFDTGDGGWTTGGTNSSWEFGVPATADLNSAFSGTEVWVTNADGNYNNNERSWVESPSIDLSAATTDPELRLAVAYVLEGVTTAWDVAWLSVSTNGGASWRTVGAIGSGTNWYDANWSEASQAGWAYSAPAWRIASNTLSGTAGNSDVRIRLNLGTDGSGVRQGFMFDDVQIIEDFCNNGIADPAESDVDCGGELCAPCGDGLICLLPRDCASGVCDLGVCASCDDGVQNGAETSVDCGGDVCAPCADAAACVADRDCVSSRCEAGTCTSCFDGIQNGGETAIDCGGGGCRLCLGGATCTDDAQCLSGECAAGVCTAPPAASVRWDFEGSDQGWTSGGTGSSWARGVPAGTVINRAGEGAEAWVTNLSGQYNNNELSWISSPSFNLTSATEDPLLRFLIAFETESCCDHGWVEVSTNGGTTWRKLTNSLTGGYTTLGTSQYWNGSRTAWTPAEFVLTDTAGESDVRVRFVFRSDFSSTREGFAIDEVVISPSLPDLATSIAPSPTLCDGVVVTVTNTGALPVSFFDLLTNVDGTMSTTRITRLLEPGARYDVELRASTNIEASVRAVGDADPSNDTATFSTTPRTIGMRYLETFEMGNGDFVTAGTSSSWRHGRPTNTFISSAASGTQAWVTNPTGAYNASEASYLVSPCFDFSGFGTDPRLSFAYMVDTERPNDFAFIEISTNGGTTWSKLGTFGSGANWYNDLLDDVWSGRESAAGVWVRASHPLTGAAGARAVRLRVAFVSNPTIQREGFGLDDFILMP